MMNVHRDTLYIISIVEDISVYGATPYSPHTIPGMTDVLERHSRAILREYYQICTNSNIKPRLLLGISKHIGAAICHAIDVKGIHTLVIGKRGIGKIARLILGSTSEYCLENANCNVVIVKKEFTPKDIPISHLSKSQDNVHQLEGISTSSMDLDIEKISPPAPLLETQTLLRQCD